MKLEINNYFNIPKPIRRFIDSYNTTIDYFNESIERCTPNWSNHRDSIAVVKNTDLWIEAHIELFPELIEFREHVKFKLQEKGITPHPDFVYEPENNHYYFKGNLTWKELTEALKGLDKPKPVKKRLFQVIDDMNVHDAEKNTRFVEVSSNFIAANKIKQGGKIELGITEQTLMDLLHETRIPVLLTVDKAEYNKRMN